MFINFLLCLIAVVPWEWKDFVYLFFLLFLLFLLVFIFILLFYCINFFLRLKLALKVKINAFESGFISVGKIQNSFSIHFFIIILMFIIFDLEVVIFLGVLVRDFFSFLRFFFIFFFIVGGFYIEWYYGKLVWVV